MAAESTWVRVESEGELRAGMAVRISRCRCCGKNHLRLLLPARDPDGWCVEGGADSKWNPIGNGYGCLCASIRERRLYRLALSEPSQDVASADRERERVR